MTASTSVHSNALNFMGLLENSVDPRTGQYTVSIKLPELAVNDLRGPNVPLALAYDPLNTLDSGYGTGWNLQLSQFNPRNKVISLSTGETFKVTGDGPNGRQEMSEQKLDSFRLYQVSASRYEVVHKSGVVEVLGPKGSGEHGLFMPIEIHSPIGHQVTLDYLSHNGYPILNWIKDAAGQTLLWLERTTYEVVVQLQPFSGPEGTPLASFVMRLSGAGFDKQVRQLVLPTENGASWRFDYRPIMGHPCIVSVDTPTGAHEDLYYGDQGHQFPQNSGRDPLPRVTRHVLSPGSGQPAVEVRYQYRISGGGNNFLGAGLEDLIWSDSGLDNLYQHAGVYLYDTVESLYLEGRETRRIERTFNQFHLLTLQKTTQGNTVQTIETVYHMKQGDPFERQPPQCQLPATVTTRWTLNDDPNRYREEIVATEFDPYGNLTRQLKANGIVETHEWYPADGEDGCPAHHEKFVRYLKSTTVTPAPGTPAAPVLCTRFRYRTLPVLAGSRLAQWLTRESESQLRLDGGEQLLQQHVFSYCDDPTDAFTHGQVSRETVKINEYSTFSDYSWSKRTHPDSGQLQVQTTQIVTCDFDDTRKSLVREQSVLTGLETSTLADGVQTVSRYDTLGRVVEETVAPDTPYVASRTYSYFLCAIEDQQAEQTVRNARGVRTRTVLDGLGRAVLEERDHIDNDTSTQMRTVYEATYDAVGHLQQQAQYDWREGVAFKLSSQFAYDDWNEQRCETGPDGVEHHRVTDPIGTPVSGGPIQYSWSQSPSAPVQISERTETWMSLFGKPSCVIAQDANQQEVSRESLVYDGLGRCIEQRDELNLVTRFTYDDWSRMTETQLPDDTFVRRTYAPHSNEELPIRVEAGDTLDELITVGQQSFDGLGRRTRLIVGQRVERFSYNAGEDQISQRITGAGATLNYSYDLQLTQEPTAIAEGNQTKASFVYDPTSARITLAQNALGEREYDYDIQNQLRLERWVDAEGERWETLHSSSSQGRPLKRTDLKRPSVNGLDTFYEYDGAGRPDFIRQDTLQATLEYNALGQLWRTTTHDLAANTRLVVEQAYDDQGREIMRTVNGTEQPEQTLEQHWRTDGLLESRAWRQGTKQLSETFEYDARGRLTGHVCEGEPLPRDELGRAFTRQAFLFDALDNLDIVTTTLPDEERPERTSFLYEDPNDPCQLTGLRYTPPRPGGNPVFSYDADGNQRNDRQGRILAYDTQGRLTGLRSAEGETVGSYGYDGHDQLVTTQHGSSAKTLRFYEDNDLSCVVQGDQQIRLLQGPQGVLGQQQVGDESQNLLLMGDANGSVRVEQQAAVMRNAVYSAYGERHSDEPLQSLTGYNGEVQDSASGWYLLGKGYRAYEPGLMRFHSPDSLSPFDSGGLNPYAYCLGNPIALRDPTGHKVSGSRLYVSGVGMGGSAVLYNRSMERYGGGGGGFMMWAMVGFMAIVTVASIVATVATFGAAFPAAAASASATAGSAAGATASSLTASALGATATAAGTTAATVGPTSAVVTFSSLAASEAVGLVSVGTSTAGMLQQNQKLMQIGDITGYASMVLGAPALGVGIGKSVAKRLAKRATKTADDLAEQSARLNTSMVPIPRAALSRVPSTSTGAGVSNTFRPTPIIPTRAMHDIQRMGGRHFKAGYLTEIVLPEVGGEKLMRKYNYAIKTRHLNSNRHALRNN